MNLQSFMTSAGNIKQFGVVNHLLETETIHTTSIIHLKLEISPK
jgi:hypothetical protein